MKIHIRLYAIIQCVFQYVLMYVWIDLYFIIADIFRVNMAAFQPSSNLSLYYIVCTYSSWGGGFDEAMPV